MSENMGIAERRTINWNVVLLGISTTAALIIFIIFDLIFGKLVIGRSPLSLEEKPYLQKEHGWYELKPNFSGLDEYGRWRFPVATGPHGFRKAMNFALYANYDVIFLGDSYTYGINGAWEETFVGMFEEHTGKRILNTGVTSYSPTPYLHQYNKALEAGLLSPGHIVIVGLDISDVQDEAGLWVDGKEHPQMRDADFDPPVVDVRGLRFAIMEGLPISYSIYSYFKRMLLPQSVIPDPVRSAFTYEDWSILDQTDVRPDMQGYAPLGVAGGLKRIEEKLGELVAIANTHEADVYIVTWPWPAQIQYADGFSWSNYADELCQKLFCNGVIDTIPLFRALSENDDDWYRRYYLYGDMHFNAEGNRIIAEALVEEVFGK